MIPENGTCHEWPLIEQVEGVCGGDPVVVGTRITAAHLYALMTKLCWSIPKIVKEYPQLTHQQVIAAYQFIEEHPCWWAQWLEENHA